jgi:UDP-N-acetylglucosamine diphosphorylase/glucosamine-1-phosphate N-acetyltransferase
MRIAFYEDRAAERLSPLALARPVFELVCGQFSLRERMLRRCDVSEWGAFLRPYLAETYREAHPEARVNDFGWLGRGTTLLLNGRWLPTLEALSNIAAGDAGFVNDTLVYLTLDPLESSLLKEDSWNNALVQIARSRRMVAAAGAVAEYPWDLVNRNADQLSEDFRLRVYGLPQLHVCPQIAIVGPLEKIAVDASARIDPFVVLDSRKGPVSVDAGAVVGSFTHLEGPCHVGHESQLFRAHVRAGTTIGPGCRVGGEVEASILHAYVNKYHTGFLGHSYVCPWVNLGALTTTSDLRNDYAPVRVPVDGELVESGSTKVGCFIGDHTKTGLGCLFNTGSSIGMMSMILPDGRLLPKHIPPFSRHWRGELTEVGDLDQHLETVRLSMGRRNQELTAAQRRLLEFLFEHTRPDREEAIALFRERQALAPS